jgi:osmoprotectant transport system permease protein
MRRVDANRLGIHRLSDLAPHANRLRIGADYELFQRSEWRSIIRNYGLSFAEQRSMDPSLLYEAAKSGQVDIIGAFSTDGRIAAYDLVVLDDDRGAIPPYDAVILAGARAQRELKSVIQSLHGLEGRIDANTMRKLNQKVDEDHLTPEAAAKTFTAPAPP